MGCRIQNGNRKEGEQGKNGNSMEQRTENGKRKEQNGIQYRGSEQNGNRERMRIEWDLEYTQKGNRKEWKYGKNDRIENGKREEQHQYGIQNIEQKEKRIIRDI